MKSIKTLMIAAAVVAASSTAMADYNRVSISYDNTRYMYNKDFKVDSDYDGFGANGFGFNYMHGFALPTDHPMYIEVGGNINFMFGANSVLDEDFDKYRMQFQNVNLQIPVNYTWRFALGDNFKISPFAGLNFKLNMMSKMRYGIEYFDGGHEWGKWINLFSDSADNMVHKDYTWNVFQMGWQIGVNFSFRQFVLGLQYGTDFIPAYRHNFKVKNFSSTPAVNTGNFKLSLGFEF